MGSDDLVYSKDALEAKATFYDKDYTIYVEGKDDLLFWNKICRLADLKNYHIEDVGGDPINDYRKILENEVADFIVACDLNFDDFINKKKTPRIVTTYGHSIENSMYILIDKIDHIIGTYSKSLKSFKKEIEAAFKDLTEKIYYIILYDIANEVFDKSIAVLTNSCNRYLATTHSYELCEKKIKETIRKIEVLFSKEEIDFCLNKLKKTKKDIWFYIRGHFLTTWIYKLIKTLSESHSSVKTDISYDSIYSAFIDIRKSQKDINYSIKLMRQAAADMY